MRLYEHVHSLEPSVQHVVVDHIVNYSCHSPSGVSVCLTQHKVSFIFIEHVQEPGKSVVTKIDDVNRHFWGNSHIVKFFWDVESNRHTASENK